MNRTEEKEIIEVKTNYGALQYAIILEELVQDNTVQMVYMNQRLYYLKDNVLRKSDGTEIGEVHNV